MTLRLDRYAPEWARGIVEDLDAGIPGHVAVANAAGALRYQADEAEQRAILADQHAEEWNAQCGKMICWDTFARQNRELGQRMRLEAAGPAPAGGWCGDAQGRSDRLRDPAMTLAATRGDGVRLQLTHETDRFTAAPRRVLIYSRRRAARRGVAQRPDPDGPVRAPVHRDAAAQRPRHLPPGVQAHGRRDAGYRARLGLQEHRRIGETRAELGPRVVPGLAARCLNEPRPHGGLS